MLTFILILFILLILTALVFITIPGNSRSMATTYLKNIVKISQKYRNSFPKTLKLSLFMVLRSSVFSTVKSRVGHLVPNVIC